MKKVLIGISVVLISVFVMILAVNAQNGPQETRKSCPEMSKRGTKCPAASSCCKMKYGSTAQAKTCDQSKCKEKGCDPATCKEDKCNKANCKTASAAAPCAAKKYDQAKTKPGSAN